MTRMRRGVVVLALLMTVLGSPALAQEPGIPDVDFVVTPARVEVRVGPGESLEVPMTVYNRGSAPLELATYVEDIEIDPSNLVSADELAFTASKWTRFSESTLTVPAQDRRMARLRITVPEDAPVGGYHAHAFFQSQSVTADELIVQSGRIGATVLLDVAPAGSDIARSAKVAETAIDVHWDGLFSPAVEASTTVTNTGDAHVVAGGLHTYRTFPGTSGTEFEIGPQSILRGTRHTFTSSFDSVPLLGKVTVTSELVYQVGPDELPVIVTQASVWIIPWHLLMALALLGAGIWFLLRRRRRRRRPVFIRSTQYEQAKERSWLEPESAGSVR